MQTFYVESVDFKTSAINVTKSVESRPPLNITATEETYSPSSK
jgi:hypothetical protein